jgi:drug/metabolite transporter (DMT)-like permease
MESHRIHRRRGLIVAGLISLVSGVSVFLNGYGVRAWADPVAYTAVKNVIAAALLGAVAAPMLRRHSRRPGPKRWRALAVIGLVGGGIPFVLFFEGLAITDPARAALIHKSLVLWVVVLAVPVLRERLGGLQIGAIGLLLAGQAMLGPGAGAGWGRGDLMILAATLMWAVEVVLVKRVLAHDVDPVLAGAARLGFGALVLAAWTLIGGGGAAVAAATPDAWVWVGVTAGTLAVFVGGWYTALALAPAVDVTALLVPGAIVTGALSAGVRGTVWPDPVATVLLVAGAVIVAAARRPTTR